MNIFKNKQSSLVTDGQMLGMPPESHICGQPGGIDVVSKVDVHGLCGCGGCHRVVSLGAAYGMDKN